MPIELKNSMFIHVPKCGGRTVKMMLKKHVLNSKVVGDDVYESHATPPTNKQVFGFIRHPATFIHSLWTHRSKKKVHGDCWNWQPYLRLEKDCQSSNFNQFVENVLRGKNYVLDYYEHYLGKYKNAQYCKMEDLPNSLISVLKQNNEDFDEEAIRENIYVHGANDRETNIPVSLANSMKNDQLSKLVTISESILCKKYNYNAF